jgi:predicted GNAT family N-acyltransferase
LRFVSEELDESHELSQFDCGRAELDRWLRDFARHAQASRTGRTFIWHAGEGVVVAYYTLAAHEVAKVDLPKRVGRGGPDRVPAALLARLALDRKLHGQRLGAQLLVDALARIIEASRKVAVRVVVVDAIDEQAAEFYRHFGFAAVADHPHRLYQKLSDIEAAQVSAKP